MFYTHYHKLPYSKQWEIKFKRRIKLNNNIYKICFVFWSLGTHDKVSRISTVRKMSVKNDMPLDSVTLCNSCITEIRSSFSKRLLRSCSNVVNTPFPDKRTSRVSLDMFSSSFIPGTLFVITSLVSEISASFSLKHLCMLIVVWRSALLVRSKDRLFWIRTTNRVDSFSTKTKIFFFFWEHLLSFTFKTNTS